MDYKFMEAPHPLCLHPSTHAIPQGRHVTAVAVILHAGCHSLVTERTPAQPPPPRPPPFGLGEVNQ